MSSAYVAYRRAVPIEQVASNDIDTTAVVVYLGPECHFVQYPLHSGEMFNQVAVFESAKAPRPVWRTGARPTSWTPPSPAPASRSRPACR